MNLRTFGPACFALASLGCATLAAAEEPAAAPTATEGEARAYLGFGLIATSGTQSLPGFPDADSGGGGIGANGAGHSRPITPSLDIAFAGQVALMGREFDRGGEETGDVLYEVDGGIRISQIVMLTLGYSTQVTGYDQLDLATSYTVIPIGIGILHTHDKGYVMGQLRLGGGRASNDQNNDTEGLGYVGLRGVLQHGAANGVQFMVGLGLDKYELDDSDLTDEFFRLELGLGFGI